MIALYVLKVYMLHFLFRLLSIDYAYSIVLVARRMGALSADQPPVARSI
ncbi:MAG: hypothetical protein ABSE25_07995 [Syntrophorhabdales bacterium]